MLDIETLHYEDDATIEREALTETDPARREALAAEVVRRAQVEADRQWCPACWGTHGRHLSSCGIAPPDAPRYDPADAIWETLALAEVPL